MSASSSLSSNTIAPPKMNERASERMICHRCAIDMLAGPSEVLVIADSTANVETVAADLLAQASKQKPAKYIRYIK